MSQAILFETFPPEKRGIASAAFGLGVVVAPVLGPTLGGWITETYTWRWAFYINIPIGILAVVLIMRFVQDPPHIRNAKPGRLDAIGLGLLTLWLGALQIILDKGQEDDWFGAIWIRWAFAVLITAFVAFLIWELVQKKPLVNLRIFTNRNFAVGCVLIALFGVVIYGIVTILPLFFQTLLGYTALAAGWAVSPRGMGAIVAMPFIGAVDRARRRTLADCHGLSRSGRLYSVAGKRQPRNRRIFDVLGHYPERVLHRIRFCAAGDYGHGAGYRTNSWVMPRGLYNLLRNVGGSVGISVVNTLLVRRAQVHQSELTHSLTLGTPEVQQRLQAIAAALARHSDPVTAMSRARKILELSLMQQSQLWAYVDDFRYLALLCFACIPIAFVLQRVRSRPGGARIAAH